MALLQVRNFPDDVYETIADIAKREKRSIARQAILLIEKGLGADENERNRRQSAIERTLAREPFTEAIGVDFAAMVREDRSR